MRSEVKEFVADKSSKPKINYFISSLSKSVRNVGFSCPSCGCPKSSIEDRKLLVTSLRRCSRCQLLFRTPTTTANESNKFYQQDYSQEFTTDMPEQQELEALLNSAFKGSEKDYTAYLSVLKALGCRTGNDAVLDFGCSWGYGSWQMMRAGYWVEAFEISTSRCAYARKQLGVNATDTLSSLRGPYDIFFSAHVLEHVPSVSEAIAFAWQVLRPGGLFVAFTPNGSLPAKEANPQAWHKLWGLVHPQILDDVFYSRAFLGSPHLLASRPYDLSAIMSWTGESIIKLDMTGSELLVAVRKT